MNDADKWKDLDDKQIASLSEGFCPWNAATPCQLGSGKVLRNGEVIEFGHCMKVDALVRIHEGEPEVVPLEAVFNKGWRLIECRT